VGSVLIQLLPLVIGSMMMPTWIMLVLSLLTSEHGRVGAGAFVGGITAVRLLQGVIFGAVTVAYITRQTSRAETIVVSTLLLAAGILMWATALRQLFAQDEPGTLIAKWMTLLTALTPLRAFGLGALLVVTSARSWLFLLSAIGLISQAELSTTQRIVAFLFYVLGAELLLVAPILVAQWAPARFDALSTWLLAYDRQITIVVSVIVGGFFLWYGAGGLIDLRG
jgi:hypothetical protein